MWHTDPYGPIRVRSARTARIALREAHVLSTYSTPTERRWAARHLDAVETWLGTKRLAKLRWALLHLAVRGLRADLALDAAR